MSFEPFDIHGFVSGMEDRVLAPKKPVKRSVVHVEPMKPHYDTRTEELIHERPVGEPES